MPPFKPYWKITGQGRIEGPFSWVFFVVARVAGRHRPVAVVSSIGDNLAEESLMGGPLVAACQRTITIFSDSANAVAVRAELALADDFYMRSTRGGSHSREEYRPDTVELPELDRYAVGDTPRHPPWDHSAVPEFPFITACLLQGVGFDARAGKARFARPQPLGTVYRDTSVEWGMVVVDITELAAVRYGIVGFTVTRAVFVRSEAHERQRAYYSVMGPGAVEIGGLHVMDEVRPRRAMSAAEYLAKWPDEFWPDGFWDDGPTLARLSTVPLVDVDAMAFVWPPGPGHDDGIFPSLDGLSIATCSDGSLEHQARTNQLIQNTLNLRDFDTAIFDDLLGVQELLKSSLISHSARLCRTPSAGKLIRLAFTRGDHLGLELLPSVSLGAISAALETSGMGHITSVSVRVDSILATPAQIAEALADFGGLRALYFLQTPGQASETLSAQIFDELSARPQILRRTKVMLAGAYSAALRKRFWLPAVPKAADAVQVAPLDVFPVQQVLSQVQINDVGDPKYERSCIHLGDALLKPERLASGLLLYFRSLIPTIYINLDGQQGLFSFSSCPASFADDALSNAEISPIPAENYAGAAGWGARMRDLVPGGWIVIVSVETHRIPGVSWRDEMYEGKRATYHCIRYAFVRSRQGRLAVDTPSPPTRPPELDAVGLREFLAATAPEVDPAVVDCRLHNLADEMDNWWMEAATPPGVQRVSVLTETEAAGVLMEFLKKAKSVKEY